MNKNDPLDVVFMNDKEMLAEYLRNMPKSLQPVFEREFMRRPTQRAADASPAGFEDEEFDALLDSDIDGK
jgi:hypothetical protein